MLFFDHVLPYLKDVIAYIGILVIIMGALRSFYQLVMYTMHKNLNMNRIRYDFGNNIILGLEFILAAEIIDSVLKQNYYKLALLAILVIVGTLLSYYLLSKTNHVPQSKE